MNVARLVSAALPPVAMPAMPAMLPSNARPAVIASPQIAAAGARRGAPLLPGLPGLPGTATATATSSFGSGDPSALTPAAVRRRLDALKSTNVSAMCCGHRSDPTVVGALYAFKAARFLSLWVALFTVDKLWRDAVVQSVVDSSTVDPAATPKPPSMRWIMAAALGLELVVLLVLVFVLAGLNALLGGAGARWALDACFLRLLVADYVITSAVLVVLGVLVASVAEDRKLFRYGDDGMRGVRATTTMLWLLTGPVLLLPAFRMG